MARRSDHTREQLRELTIEAARNIASKSGLRDLKARQIMRDVGYTIGTFYNLFDDLDDLIVQMNCATLDDLYQECAKINSGADPIEYLHALAKCYVQFTRRNPNLWSVLFEHRLPNKRTLPDYYYARIIRLQGLIEHALEPFFDSEASAEKEIATMVLWTSVYGMCSLETAKKLPDNASVELMVDSLISNFVAGIRQS